MRATLLGSLFFLIFVSQAHGAPSWQPVSQTGIPNSLLLTDIHVINDKIWISTSSASDIYYSSNGGTNFSSQTTNMPNNSIVMLSETEGYIGGTSGVTHHTTNGGGTWAVGSTFLPSTIRSISFSPAGTGYCVGDSGWVGNITSGGVTNTSKLVNAILYSVSFPVDGEGWLCGGSIIRHYINGAWGSDLSGTNGYFTGLFFLDQNYGWVVGDGGQIIHTSNGHDFLTQRAYGSGATLSGIYFINSNTGWAVGSGGTILYTSNGGSTWTTQTSGTSAELMSIFAISSTDAWIVGDNTTLLHYTETTPSAPNIQVDRRDIPFGGVTIGSQRDEVITVTNTGTADLIVGQVAQSNPLSLPFSKQNDTCSGQTLSPSAQCTITVRFEPSAVGASNDSFDIPSSDIDESSIEVSVIGNGLSVETYTLTYNGNGNTQGTVPVDNYSPYSAGATVTVLGNTGNLGRDGLIFNNWNNQADGLGISYTPGEQFVMSASNLILYAQYIDPQLIPTLNEWGMIIMAGLLAVSSFFVIRKKIRAF